MLYEVITAYPVFGQHLQQLLGVNKLHRHGISCQDSFFAFPRKAAQGYQGAMQAIMVHYGFAEFVQCRPSGCGLITFDVITSYSIHYTKLYESGGWHDHGQCIRGKGKLEKGPLHELSHHMGTGKRFPVKSCRLKRQLV